MTRINIDLTKTAARASTSAVQGQPDPDEPEAPKYFFVHLNDHSGHTIMFRCRTCDQAFELVRALNMQAKTHT